MYTVTVRDAQLLFVFDTNHRRRRRCDYRRRRYDTRDVRQSLCSRGRRSRVVCTSFLSRAITVHSVTVQGQQARVRCTPPRVDGYQPSTKPLRPHCIRIRVTEYRDVRCAGIHARKRNVAIATAQYVNRHLFLAPFCGR